MKVLQIINALGTGGAEKLLLETIPLYKGKGIEMDILVLNGEKHPFMKELINLDCCNVFSLGNGSVYNPMSIFKIIPYLKKYDSVHVHLFPSQYWVVLAKIISFSNVKLIFTEHNTSNRRMHNKLFQFFDKIIYSFYDHVICITVEVKEALSNHLGKMDDKFQVINNGVNIDLIKKSLPYSKNRVHDGIYAGDIILIQVAGFREQKDQPTVIKALQYLPGTVKLLLVGDGVLRKECELLVQNLKLEKRVFFLGIRMDVPQLLKTADMSVLSSNYEGFGLVAVEGMAAGKPVLASDVPGLAEVVKGAGILFEQGNPEDLADEIMKLLNDKAYYVKVSDACQNRAGKYDIQKMVDKHITVYESVS